MRLRRRSHLQRSQPAGRRSPKSNFGGVLNNTIHAAFSDSHAIIEDPVSANQVYSKGFFGTMQSGGKLKLHLIEAMYLQDIGKIKVRQGGRSLPNKRLMRHALASYPQFEIKYVVYRDLRQRGYIVKPSPAPMDFRVLPRGGQPKKSPSKYWVLAISERSIFEAAKFKKRIDKVREARKEFLLGVVDEEGDLTYYLALIREPKGTNKPRQKIKAEGMFLEDRAMVFEPAHAKYLHDNGFYGKELGDALQLSLIETAYLMKKGLLVVKNGRTGRSISEATFLKDARAVQKDFDTRLQVYEDLKARGLIVKTGFKYGSHFRAYSEHPDSCHARFLVHAVPKSYKSMWPEMSRAIRLAHGVKKEMLFGLVGKDVTEYIKLTRVRP
jgi:tRNA-intron endonuclease